MPFDLAGRFSTYNLPNTASFVKGCLSYFFNLTLDSGKCYHTPSLTLLRRKAEVFFIWRSDPLYPQEKHN